MTAPRYGSPGSPSGERWNVNLPAVIGVIFVFLVGVVVWVIVDGRDGDSGDSGDSGDDAAPASVTPAPVATDAVDAAGTTTPAPMPSTSIVDATTTTTSTTAATEVTTAAGADPDAVPGDLGIAGRAMQRPGCDGAFITILASAVGDQATAGGIANVLDSYPGSNYLRTDQTCPSLTPAIDGAPIYVVYFGPFAFDTDACAARADGPEGAYARALSTELGPDHGVPCA